jgi:hypothetical protein
MNHDKDSVFTALPCLGCTSSWQRDRALWILGLIYLMLEKGEKPRIPTREELLAGCCRREDMPGRTITFLKGEESREQMLEIEHPPLR